LIGVKAKGTWPKGKSHFNSKSQRRLAACIMLIAEKESFFLKDGLGLVAIDWLCLVSFDGSHHSHG